jgi:hypothetical protein
MRDDDREHPMDDDSAHRSETGDDTAERTPAIRLLANPRRIRRS